MWMYRFYYKINGVETTYSTAQLKHPRRAKAYKELQNMLSNREVDMVGFDVMSNIENSYKPGA